MQQHLIFCKLIIVSLFPFFYSFLFKVTTIDILKSLPTLIAFHLPIDEHWTGRVLYQTLKKTYLGIKVQ